jgi:hypothetical protein
MTRIQTPDDNSDRDALHVMKRPHDGHSTSKWTMICVLAILIAAFTACADRDTPVPPIGSPVDESGEQARRESTRCADSSCAIELVKLTTLSDAEEPGLFGSIIFVQIDGVGRFVTSTLTLDRIAVFDSSAKLVAILGRAGAGPGEFRRVMTPIPGPSDTLFGFDLMLRKLAVFSPELELVREFKMDHYPSLILPNGDLLISEQVSTREGAGYPLHVFSRDGHILRSFGTDTPQFRPDMRRLLTRSAGPARDGRFIWAVTPGRYVLERFEVATGTRVEARRIDAEWFGEANRSSGNVREVRPAPVLTDVWEDDAGIVWVLGQDADNDWRPMTGPDGPLSNEEYDRSYDYILNAIHAETGRLLASRRFDNRIWTRAPSGVLVTRGTQTVDRVAFDVWVPTLRRLQ